MSTKEQRDIFLNSPISGAFIGSRIAAHSSNTGIGGHSIFLGQVRQDIVAGRRVAAINYTTYREMALARMGEIREEIFEKYDLSCLHVYHSLCEVKAGEICLFVFTSSKHRQDAIQACQETVERIKADLPIWGQEVFEDSSTQWKINK